MEILQRDPERDRLVQFADFLASLLDTVIRIPATNLTISLDPLLSLIPGIGDATANLVGSPILVPAARLRVPRIVLVLMSLNLLINGILGWSPESTMGFRRGSVAMR